ncbi:hypothetical protein HNR23_001648 [Nocardiopsis mwathae]|uniref:Alpha/beta hydrolase n=1 Tax=Nocardiopsis mwathae TaxID=1472723 RepID=A0A7X0D4V6_9ACTN|nr:alpha/beta fold hydrolase [Nocardiopsis mwathae]MBB6171588.1 hypothetical protein [Nocardiopsis mwathae]
MAQEETWHLGRNGPWLVVSGETRHPRAAVLLIHGGDVTDTAATTPWEPAVLRMIPFAWALRRAWADSGLLVARLRLRVRGWNGADADALADTRRALEEIERRRGPVPVVTTGHSMGGRAVLQAADAPHVRGVLGLAPWIVDGDPVEPLGGRHLLIAHADFDINTSPAASRAYVGRARGVAASADFVPVHLDSHPMVRMGRWNELTVAFTGRVLGWVGARTAVG